MKEKMEKVLYAVSTTILSVILLMEIIMILQIIFSKDKIPTLFGYKPLIVVTDIMKEEIEYGDLIFIKTVDTNTLEKGDIITYWYENKILITDRIVDIEKNNQETIYITKGDNNENIDEYETNSKQVEGKYEFRIHGFGNVLMYLADIKNILKLMLIIVILGIIWIAAGRLLEKFPNNIQNNKKI